MGVLYIMAAGAAILLLGGTFYAPLIGKILGEQPGRTTPAIQLNDGRDYVPTKTWVVFAHHYASIAGGGPIIGPVLGIIYGWGPAVLWLIIGGVFIGAVHDFVATYIAMREGGKNITIIARRYMGPAAFIMMLILLIALLALVCAAFLDLSGKTLVSSVALSDLGMAADQTMFPQIAAAHAVTGVIEPHALIGGTAFTSVIVITLCSPLIGFLYLKKQVAPWICSLLSLAICALSILIGLHWPITIQPMTWKLGVAVYVLFSAGMPVWLFLQSRDFINVHILYVGIAFLVVSVIAAAIRGGGEALTATSIPMFNPAASARLGPPWPLMFVLISCGAVSGFHSLCAGGTTCKQLNNELAARRVGYWAMLLESFLALCVVCCLMVGLSKLQYEGYCYPTEHKGNAVLTFAMAVAHTAHTGLGVPVAAGAIGALLLLGGFLVTTLDTAIRLTRYMFEEGWATLFRHYDVFRYRFEPAQQTTPDLAGTGGLAIDTDAMDESSTSPPLIKTTGLKRLILKALQYYWVNSGLAVALMLILALTNGYNAVWKIFGSGNQMLAAMALLIGTVWLIRRGRSVWFTLLPAAFMLITSFAMLFRLLFTQYIPGIRDHQAGMWPLAVADILVIIMAAGISLCAARAIFTKTNTTTLDKYFIQ